MTRALDDLPRTSLLEGVEINQVRTEQDQLDWLKLSQRLIFSSGMVLVNEEGCIEWL